MGMSGTHLAMKIGRAVSTVCTPDRSAAMASVAAFTAAAGSVEPPGAPVPPVPLDACDELVPDVD